MKTRPKITLFGMSIDSLNMQESVAAVLEWCESPRQRSCLYVVTPNVDHTVMFQTSPALRDAYADAALVLADGAPVVWASRLLGRRLPERVAGSGGDGGGGATRHRFVPWRLAEYRSRPVPLATA